MERNQAKKQNILIPAEAIGNNIDLLTEILIRLQVKPLGRAKCVSKQWLSLISDPKFCVSHNRHHHTPYPTPTALLFDNCLNFKIVPLKQDTIPKVISFDYLNAPNLIRIKQSCNGLLLFSSEFCFTEKYYICNPITKQFKSLSFPSSEFEQSVVSVCMAFDPLKSNHYKLISIRAKEDEEKYQIDLYSSETDSWSLLGITFSASDDIQIADAVFCNGAVHWYFEDETSLYFDVEKECLSTMPNLDNHIIRYFGESRGHLHLIVTEWPHPLQFDVMEMAADYSGWFVRYHVNLDAVRIAFPDLIWHHQGYPTFSVLHVIQAQKDEDSIVVIHVNNNLISYNVHDGTSKMLCEFEPHLGVEGTPSWFDNHQYFGILTSV